MTVESTPAKIETIRLFVAIELEEPVRDQLALLQQRVRAIAPGLRYARAEAIHCTLKFLGNTPVERVEAARAALGELDAPSPRELSLGRLGVFRGRQGPRVVWCGLEGDVRGLRRLAGAVNRALAGLGFPPEARPYSPHLTLARVPEGKSLPPDLVQRLLALPTPEPLAIRTHEISLMRSAIQPGGAVYTRLEVYRLAGDESPQEPLVEGLEERTP